MTSLHVELAQRMSRPQRHRLLQGYPMVPLMRRAVPDTDSACQLSRRLDGALIRNRDLVDPPWIDLDPSRPLLIGVLPHTQCNPRVEGCGFCTFPHDRYDKYTLRAVVNAVEEQIRAVHAVWPELGKREVPAVYFGGATANLTPRSCLQRLGETLCRCFDLTAAEVTLEGVPSLFRSLLAGPFEWLLEMPAAHRRISMGVQTFDATQLARMGRQAFGDRKIVERVVSKAHRNRVTASADFLINLPGQPLNDMLNDVGAAIAMGLDQVCIYHLVLTPELGVPWAADESIMQSLPSIEAASQSFLAVREVLLAAGYVQTTLTNFERVGSPRFLYEDGSFHPQTHDAIGFGPLSVTTFIDRASRRAVKTLRGKSMLRALGDATPTDLYFPYDEPDLKLLFLTRTLARLAIDRSEYADWFGSDVASEFAPAWEAASDAGLLRIRPDRLELTPAGMFYADSIVGLVTSSRADEIRSLGAGTHTKDVLQARTVVDFMG